MIIGVVVLLIIIIIVLVVYNISIHRKIENFSNINQKITSLNVLQDFMNTISESSSVDEKIKKINDIIIERYEIKYSTIVIFNGAEYLLKASNVDEKHWDTLKNLHKEEVFKESIQTARPKYITVNNEQERLPYQKMEFGRAKSAMFFPLYIDNVYIGYWIIESSVPHDFDHVDTTILEVIKENIITVLKTVQNQKVIESIVRKDKFSGLNSAEYLYGKGKKIIDKYTTSAVTMFRITNLEKINDTVGRKTGDRVIQEVSEFVKKNIAPEYVFVRYMGPKFVIVFSGVEAESVIDFIKSLKQKMEKLEIEQVEEIKKKQKVSPTINFVVSTYYKGTGMEEITKKLEEYLDQAESGEHDISYI